MRYIVIACLCVAFLLWWFVGRMILLGWREKRMTIRRMNGEQI